MSGRWSRRAVLSGAGCAALAAGQAAAQSPFKLPFGRSETADPTRPALNPIVAATPGRQHLGPAGYSARFQPVRDLVTRGDVPGALNVFLSGGAEVHVADEEAEAELSEQADAEGGAQGLGRKKDTFLRGVEAGSLHFERGAYVDSVAAFREAEDFVAAREEKRANAGALGKMGGFIKRGGTALVSTVAGRGDFGPYRHRDYERVLQLNYLSLAYLLQGDRRAYNVARRSSVEQNLLQEKFAAEIAEAQAKAASGDTQKRRTNFLLEALDPEFAAYKGVAERVPSAYVNPLGPYLSGVIQEIVSYEQPSLRSNARVAYQQAADLQATSPQLAGMAQAMAAAPGADDRVLHVLVSEAFAPSRYMLRYGLKSDDGRVSPLRLGIFVPGESPVGRLEARIGRQTAALDPIGDYEAIVQRAQDSRKLATIVDITAAMFRDAALADLSQSLQAFGVSLDSVPDLRSWNSLPRRTHVARIAVPAGASEVTLASRTADGGTLSEITLPLSPDQRQTFLYARSDGSALRAAPPSRLWIDGKLEEI